MKVINGLNPNTRKTNTTYQLLLLSLLRPREPCKSGHACKTVGKTLPIPRTSTTCCASHHTLEAADTARVVPIVPSLLLLVVLVVSLAIIILTALCIRIIH